LFDGKGLFLLVKPTGAKLWRVKYRYGGKERLYAIGPYPETTLAEARKKRDEAREWLKADKDPVLQRRLNSVARVAKGEDTFRVVAEEWFAGKKKKWSKTYALEQQRLLDRFLLPALGTLPIGDIETSHVIEVLNAIDRRGAHELLAKSRVICKLVFGHAIATKRRAANTNPAADLTGVYIRPKVVHRATVPETEMPALFEALAEVPAEASTRLALYYQIATCVRPGEARFATWGEIDNAKKLWRIGSERMKMRVPFIQPLSPLAIAILKRAAKLRQTGEPDELLFPGFTRIGHLSENAFIALLARAGFYGRQTAHGFRATFRTWCGEQEPKRGEKEFDPTAVELCLAHRPSGVKAAYDRGEYLPARRRILTAWGEQLAAWGMKL
jgi:integrase